MAEAKMYLCKDVEPFLFPCQNCEQYGFHEVHDKPAGYGYGNKNPFFMPMPSPQAFQVVCVSCSFVNGRLEKADRNSLAAGIMPKAIYETYPEVKAFYSPGFDVDAFTDGLPADQKERLEQLIKGYRLEM